MPALALLYTYEDVGRPLVRFTATGYQWYWEYAWVGPGQGFTIEEGACIPEHAARCDAFRLLDTTGPLLLPVNVLSRILVTSGDVLHSWSVPAFRGRRMPAPCRRILWSLFRDLWEGPQAHTHPRSSDLSGQGNAERSFALRLSCVVRMKL